MVESNKKLKGIFGTDRVTVGCLATIGGHPLTIKGASEGAWDEGVLVQYANQAQHGSRVQAVPADQLVVYDSAGVEVYTEGVLNVIGDKNDREESTSKTVATNMSKTKSTARGKSSGAKLTKG